MKPTKIIAIAALLLVLAGALTAGCVNTDAAADNPTTDIASDPEPSDDLPANATIYDVLSGTWTVTGTNDAGLLVDSKFILLSDGSGVRDQYFGGKRIQQVPLVWFPTTADGLCIRMDFENPYFLYLTIGSDNKTLTNTGNPDDILRKESAATNIDWVVPATPTPTPVPTPKSYTKKNPDDYVKDGNYYLEDDNGRSFTETLWTGNIAPYVEKYKAMPKMDHGGSQAGEWVKFVRGLSKAHHAFESATPVTYQTIDETMSKGYGTCDDLAILAARGLKELGIDVAILVFPDHMDIGIGKDDYHYLHGYVDSGRYATYQTSGNTFDGYYYLNIADFQNNLDLGSVLGESKFKYDMTLKKIIPL